MAGSSICIELVVLASHSIGPTTPTFTLHGDTRGGPPTNSTWTRNGEPIANGGPYRISIAVNGAGETVYHQSRYRSVLTVTGNLPGFYQYSATNRGTSSFRTSGFRVEGEKDYK